MQPKIVERKIVDSGRLTLSDIKFEELVNKYSRQVLNVALRILRDTDLANDVHQEVFLAIWRNWQQYNGQTNWGGYLYRVTVRKAIELAKKGTMQPLTEEFQEYPATTDNPDSRLMAIELHQKIVDCLGTLPKHQAEIFALSRIEGLKHEKIAEMFGCSQNTVRVHLHRAVKQLGRQLSDYLT